MKSLFNVIALPLVLVACTGENSSAEPEKDSSDLVCIMPAPNRLNELSWMLGVWKNEESGFVTTESWEKTSDELFAGASYTVEQESGDTVFFESIEIRHESAGLVYSPVVKDQNNGEAVDFLLMNLNDSVVEFENLQHDYPQKIVYRRFGNDSMAATISGTRETGEYDEAVFPMKRVK